MNGEEGSFRSLDSNDGTTVESPPFEPLTPPTPRPKLNNKHHPEVVRSDNSANRMSALEKSVASIQSEMRNFMAEFQASYPPRRPSTVDQVSVASESDVSEEEFYSPSSFSDSEHVTPSGRNSLPSNDDPWGQGLVHIPDEPLDQTFWDPKTKEKDPDIPDPCPLLLSQGVHCQRLGVQAWSRIRYSEAENIFKRGAMFQPLVMNSIFKKSTASDLALRQKERILGTVCLGLLAQRKAFKDTMAKLLSLCPKAKDAVKECFYSESSEFHSQSSALLQFVCGKRAEVIAERRKAVMPAEGLKTLQSIPPSTSHLFDEEELRSRWTSNLPPPAPRVRSSVPRKRPMTSTPSFSNKRPKDVICPGFLSQQLCLQFPSLISCQRGWT